MWGFFKILKITQFHNFLKTYITDMQCVVCLMVFVDVFLGYTFVLKCIELLKSQYTV